MSQASRRERRFEPRTGGPIVFIATERVLPEPDPDEELLLEALGDAGLAPSLVAWDDETLDWGAAGITVIRSTWNYFRRRDSFLAWAERTAMRTALWNPAPIVTWNSHKGYLLELAAAGVPVVPTVLLTQRQPERLSSVMSVRGWHRSVVKPAVSASSYRTLIVDEQDLAVGEEHLAAVLDEGDSLVQPYLESVDGYGERAVIWIDGAFTHAVRKSPRFASDEESVSEGLPIAGDELDVARAALSTVKGPLLFARVDLARDPRGQPLVMELELIEPSLYLLQSPAALQRLVAGIRARLPAP